MNFQSLKPVRLLFVFIALCFVGVPSFRLYQEISRLSLNTWWHQRLDPDDSETRILKQFVTKLQDKIHDEYNENLRNADNSIPALSKCDENTLSAWKIKKIEGDITVNYSCLRLVDFYTEGKSFEERKQKRDQQKSNLVFRRFDNLRKNRFLPALGPVEVAEDSIIAHTRSILSYFGADDILNDLPGLRVDSLYIFHENSQVMAIYPNSVNQTHDNKDINYKTRP